MFHIGLYSLIFSLHHGFIAPHGQGRFVHLKNYDWDLIISVFRCCNKTGFYFLRNITVSKFCDDRPIISGFVVLLPMCPPNFFYDKMMFHILHFFFISFAKVTFVCSHVSLFCSCCMFLKISVFLMPLFLASSNYAFIFLFSVSKLTSLSQT